MALKLSKEGFGRPDEILSMPCDLVLAALEYSSFLMKYQDAFYELNKDGKS